MFPETSKSKQQIENWTACYKGQQNCMSAEYRNGEKSSAAPTVGPKMKLLAVVVAASLTTL